MRSSAQTRNRTDCYSKANAALLETQRAERRKRQCPLTYDCYNTIVDLDNRVRCRKTHRLGLSNDGSMDLITVLRGTTSGICRACPDYDGD